VVVQLDQAWINRAASLDRGNAVEWIRHMRGIGNNRRDAVSLDADRTARVNRSSCVHRDDASDEHMPVGLNGGNEITHDTPNKKK